MCACVCHTKVSQFELSFVVDEQVLRFEISVEDFSPVAVRQPSQQLEQKDLREREREREREKQRETERNREREREEEI